MASGNASNSHTLLSLNLDDEKSLAHGSVDLLQQGRDHQPAAPGSGAHVIHLHPSDFVQIFVIIYHTSM